MTITKESYVDLQEKFEKVKKLIEEDSKLDPENEPYVSKYTARQLLIGMKANIKNLLRTQNLGTPEHQKLTGMLGAVFLYLGVIAIDTEELSVAEEHLKICQETIESYQLAPEIIMIHLNMLNQFGILWSQREPENSKIYLEKAQSFYKQFKDSSQTPLDVHDLFKANQESFDSVVAFKNLEKVYTLTLYYLAQIYGALKDALKSSVYCHITLQRQLDSADYDPVDWALNSATLSQFFLEKNGFTQARHHLAASSYILEEYGKRLDEISERNDEYWAKVENFKHRSADIARCWGKYGLILLSISRERLLNNIDVNSSLVSDLAKLELNEELNLSKEDLQHLQFNSIDVSFYENQITDQFLLTLTDAKKVFLNVQTWLNKAHTYYTLENLASDYIEITQDQSQVYQNLLFFEDNLENQAKMHKRRIDLLENVINEVSPVYYMPYCRQIWYELGQIYSDVLDIKKDKLREANERPTPHALTKINALVQKSIENFENFVESFKDKITKVMPKRVDNEFEKIFLQAHFHISALYSKTITLDKNLQLENVKTSLECYKKVVAYCEENSEAENCIVAEMGICREMVTLLPMKVAKLMHEIAA